MQLFLDLDNTLIHAIEPNQISNLPQSFQKQFRTVDMKPYYRVFERPYLQLFLDFAFANFDVSVWTAAESDYAMFIIKNFICIKPERKLKYIFYHYHVSLGRQQYGEDKVKDLRLLWEIFRLPGVYPCNTWIVDDLEDVNETNVENCIAIPAFHVVSGKTQNNDAIFDDGLLQVKLKLENLLHDYNTYLKPGIVENLVSKFSQPMILPPVPVAIEEVA